MIYHCCQSNRKALIEQHPTLNGINYLEVLDSDAVSPLTRQHTLLLFFIKPILFELSLDQIRISGGERIRHPEILWICPASDLSHPMLSADEITFFSQLQNAEHALILRTATAGDFSIYQLRLQLSAQLPDRPPETIDPIQSRIDFSFKVECPTHFDCQTLSACQSEPSASPDIDYTAKDFSSFRNLILSRMSQLMPDWQGSSAADLGVVLAESLAYYADELSYWQDAITTEAYLESARDRTSLRRHALLVDYRISEGRNARCWIDIEVNQGPFELADHSQFLTRVPSLNPTAQCRLAPESKEYHRAREQQALVFELLFCPELRPEHNQIELYTWADSNCCLPKGATNATLIGHFPALLAGNFLLFEEIAGAITGLSSDADPKKRQVVRLTEVTLDNDPLTEQSITHIRWQSQDALQFALCVSSETMVEQQQVLSTISVARANIALVDHGESISEALPNVPQTALFTAQAASEHCTEPSPRAIPLRYRPTLSASPISCGSTLHMDSPAVDILAPSLQQTQPLIYLTQQLGDTTTSWLMRPDLLDSNESDQHYVVEFTNHHQARLRFGDDTSGKRPNSDSQFTAHYRTGNGPQGNIGAESLRHIVSEDQRIIAVRNPLAAAGGVIAETPEQIKRRAPKAFRRQQRAVTSQDYSDASSAHQGVQKAHTKLRWTGSWHTQQIAVDRFGGDLLDFAFQRALSQHLEPVRMAGQDIRLCNPIFVPLDLVLQICVDPAYFRSDIERALLASFNSHLSASGEKGLFHPDRFSFGQTIYLSTYFAAARSVTGVKSIKALRFSRLGERDNKALIDEKMQLQPLEIARLSNNPNLPEHGQLTLRMLGGK